MVRIRVAGKAREIGHFGLRNRDKLKSGKRAGQLALYAAISYVE
jgi:hypothetical protein